MSPGTGRPFLGEARKDTTVRLRMSPDEVKKLDECARAVNGSRSEAIRKALALLYEELTKTK